MGKFLNYCSVISISGSEMKEYSASRLLQQLKRAYADKVVQNGFDDTKIYNNELLNLSNVELEQFKNLKQIIGSTPSTNKLKDVINFPTGPNFPRPSIEININNNAYTSIPISKVDLLFVFFFFFFAIS